GQYNWLIENLHAPFSFSSREQARNPRTFSPHYRSCPRRIPSLPAPAVRACFLRDFFLLPVGSAPRRNHSPVRNRIASARFGKRPQAQQATVASAARHLFIL